MAGMDWQDYNQGWGFSPPNDDRKWGVGFQGVAALIQGVCEAQRTQTLRYHCGLTSPEQWPFPPTYPLMNTHTQENSGWI